MLRSSQARLIRVSTLAFAVSMAALLAGCQGPRKLYPLPNGERKVRAVWVTRWDYKSPTDIARVMDNSKSAGFNTVLFQVRGNGTVCYRSKLEPWASEFGGHDPGFDPLAVACKEAHKRNLALHAWVNVIPGWRGEGPPSDPKQLFRAHPDWFWKDASGRHQPFGWYQSLNPCYPEVRRHLVAVMREIVGRYPVDGLHMDYIRYPNEWNNSYAEGAKVPDYPRDPRTLQLYRRETGLTPDQSPQQWSNWRTKQLNILVADIRKMMNKTNPRAWLTAAVGSIPEEHRRNHFQDSPFWMQRDWVDAVYPMNYATDLATYDARLANWARMRPSKPVITGVMFDKRDPDLIREQVSRTQRLGGHFAAFAYNSLFERFDRAGKPVVDSQSSSRATLRQQVIPHMRRMSNARLSMIDPPRLSANESESVVLSAMPHE